MYCGAGRSRSTGRSSSLRIVTTGHQAFRSTDSQLPDKGSFAPPSALPIGLPHPWPNRQRRLQVRRVETDFPPLNADVVRSRDPQTHSVAADFQDLDLNLTRDHDFFIQFASEHQHATFLLDSADSRSWRRGIPTPPPVPSAFVRRSRGLWFGNFRRLCSNCLRILRRAVEQA